MKINLVGIIILVGFSLVALLRAQPESVSLMESVAEGSHDTPIPPDVPLPGRIPTAELARQNANNSLKNKSNDLSNFICEVDQDISEASTKGELSLTIWSRFSEWYYLHADSRIGEKSHTHLTEVGLKSLIDSYEERGFAVEQGEVHQLKTITVSWGKL